VALSLLEEARELSLSSREEKQVDIYCAAYDYWPRTDTRRPRPLSTVFLPDGVAEAITEDVKAFMRSRMWYTERGIPYRRGYLFHGIPGSGKTSFILALAGALKLDVYILNLPGIHTDTSLPQLLSRVPPHSIVLIEDVDATFAGREKTQGDSGLTFAGFLNALDGAASPEGWLVFMTTNHKGALDPALIRPGRADVHIEFDYATPEQAERIFRTWFPEADTELVRRFGEAMLARDMTMAELQQHLLLHKDCAEDAERNLRNRKREVARAIA
jgi:mitochondrial chaperone BCS1